LSHIADCMLMMLGCWSDRWRDDGCETFTQRSNRYISTSTEHGLSVCP